MKQFLITLITLLVFHNVISQKKSREQLIINQSYSYFYSDGDTIKYKRTPQSELRKAQSFAGYEREVGLRIATKIINVESILNNKNSGQEGYESAFSTSIADLRTVCVQNNIELRLYEYESEFQFHQKWIKQRKAKEQEAKEKARKEEQLMKAEQALKPKKRTDKIKQVYDSILIVEKRNKEISDSINLINERLHKKQVALNQKKMEENKRKQQEELEEKLKQRSQMLIREYGQENSKLILDKKVKIGWTKQMCIESWGKPKQINRTTTANYVHEQWVYSMKRYLYFDGNILTTIQD